MLIFCLAPSFHLTPVEINYSELAFYFYCGVYSLYSFYVISLNEQASHPNPKILSSGQGQFLFHLHFSVSQHNACKHNVSFKMFIGLNASARLIFLKHSYCHVVFFPKNLLVALCFYEIK